VVVDAKQLHEAKVVLWPSRRRKDIRRCPENELGARVSLATETEGRSRAWRFRVRTR
jgi:hypothetical protein